MCRYHTISPQLLKTDCLSVRFLCFQLFLLPFHAIFTLRLLLSSCLIQWFSAIFAAIIFTVLAFLPDTVWPIARSPSWSVMHDTQHYSLFIAWNHFVWCTHQPRSSPSRVPPDPAVCLQLHLNFVCAASNLLHATPYQWSSRSIRNPARHAHHGIF